MPVPPDPGGYPRGAYDAVVVAGGAAERLGGVDKPAVVVGGRRLLDRVLDALADARRVVVVGPPRPGLPDRVVTVREEPPGGGPVAAIAAGLDRLATSDGEVPGEPAGVVAVLAADLPFLTAEVLGALRAAIDADPAADGALLVDDAGHDQLLAGVWRVAALRAACLALPSTAGASVRRLVSPLATRRVTIEVGDGRPPWWDCDTLVDLERAEERA